MKILRLGLRARLVATVVAAFVLFFIVVIVAVRVTVTGDLARAASDRIGAGTDAFANGIATRVAQTQNVVAQLAAQENVQRAVAAGDRATLHTVVIGNLQPNGFSFLTIVDRHGNVLARANGIDSGTVKTAMLDEALHDAIASGVAMLDELQLQGELLTADASPFSQAPAIAGAAPIKVGGKIVGAVYAGTLLVGSAPLVDDVSHFTGGATALVIDKRLYASSLETPDGSPLVGVAFQAAPRVDGLMRTTIAGVRYLAQMKPLRDFQGKALGSLWVGIPSAQIEAVANHAMTSMLLWAIVGLAVAATAASYIVGRATRSIAVHSREVNDSARELGVLVVGSEVSGDHVDQTREKLETIEHLVGRIIPVSAEGDGARLRALASEARNDVIVIDTLSAELASRLRDAAVRVAQLDRIARSLDDIVAGAKPSQN